MGSASTESSSSSDRLYKQQQTDHSSSNSGDNVWSSILSEVRSNASVKLPSGKAVVVLGHPESGKTTLVAKLQGIEDPKKGSGLEYTYIEIRDEYREDTTQLSVFTLDGDKSHGHLLQFALNEATLANTVIIFTVSYQTPWLLVEQLQEWAGLLHDHVDSLKVPPDGVKRLRDRVVKRWCGYVEPGQDDDVTTTPRLEDKHEDGGAGGEYVLGDGVLVRNVGVDIVVVVTKTDHMSVLERDENYRDEHFDFIQYHIRKFCASYGASLFYTSVKEDKNCDLLYKYLVHLIYGQHGGQAGGFRTPALVVEKDAVFIPAGWDNQKKMQILHENMTTIHPDTDFYNDVIQRPMVHHQKRQVVVTEVEVEDEQQFLERQMQILNVGASGGNKQVQNNRTPGSGSDGNKRLSTGTGGSAASATPKKGEQCTDRVLANFFNSLLTSKKSGGGSGPSSANTSLSGTDC